MLAILIKTKRRTLFSSSADDVQTCSDDLHICNMKVTLHDPACRTNGSCNILQDCHSKY